jgi:hypothetical protein
MVICALVYLSMIICFIQKMPPSLVTRGVNPVATLVSASSIPRVVTISAAFVVRLRSVNKHFWRRCRGGNRHKILFKHCCRIIMVW